MRPEDWIKNKQTNKYEWRSNVSSQANTPAGYTYVGKEDNAILKDLGLNVTYSTATTKQIGYIAADAENEGPATYGVSHVIGVTATTSLYVKAEVSTKIDFQKNEVSKEFLGVSLNLSTTTRTTTGEEIKATGTATASANGEEAKTQMIIPDYSGPTVKEVGATTTTGSFILPRLFLVFDTSKQNKNYRVVVLLL